MMQPLKCRWCGETSDGWGSLWQHQGHCAKNSELPVPSWCESPAFCIITCTVLLAATVVFIWLALH